MRRVYMKEYKLYEAEYRFMCTIWDHEPVNSTKLSKLCLEIYGWKKSTTYNLIRKLSEKGLVKNERATVVALVKRDEVNRYESEELMDRAFDNSLPSFLSTFLKDKKLSKKEADRIKEMIEEATL